MILLKDIWGFIPTFVCVSIVGGTVIKGHAMKCKYKKGECIMKKVFKQISLGLLLIITAMSILCGSTKITLGTDYDKGNLATTYTEYKYYYNIWTAKPKHAYKDVYTGTNKTVKSTYTKKFKGLYTWQGPTKKKKEISYTSGTSRSSSFTGGIDKSYVKASASYSYGSSWSTTEKDVFSFPGDKKKHTLYQSRTDNIIEGYTSRKSYITSPKSYKWIPRIASWNVTWGSWKRDSSRDMKKRKTIDTTEYIYGHYMN